MTDAEELRAPIDHLSRLDRASGSPGEREAAEWIAAALRERGAAADVELELVHPTYRWPLGIAAAAGAVAALGAQRGRRLRGVALGLAGAGAAVDELIAGRRYLRDLLPKRPTANVVAVAGDAGAAATLVVAAHHDAARSGLVFDPRLAELVGERLGTGGTEEVPSQPPLMVPLAAGPALGALAAAMRSRRLALLATAVCAGIVATFVDIGARRAVPGANDNLSGVTALLALARSLQREPVRGLRVLLVSTGSEEALMEGMRAFLARHAGELSASRTWLLCLDTIGSPRLVLPGAEGMLDTRAHDPMLRTLVADAARDHGVPLATEMRMRLGTDAYVAMRHGIPAALLTSVDRYGGLSNYHWPTDTPDRVDYGTLAGAVTLCDAVVRRLAARADGLRT